MTNLDRTCKSCGRTKPLDSFPIDRRYTLGRLPQCKACRYEYRRAVVYPKLKTTEPYIARHRVSVKKYAKDNPEKVRAHRLAKKIPLSPECESCGGGGLLHRHHPDYSEPLKIVTLCVTCHEAAHHGAMV